MMSKRQMWGWGGGEEEEDRSTKGYLSFTSAEKWRENCSAVAQLAEVSYGLQNLLPENTVYPQRVSEDSLSSWFLAGENDIMLLILQLLHLYIGLKARMTFDVFNAY